jgi:hypothetical protein
MARGRANEDDRARTSRQRQCAGTQAKPLNKPHPKLTSRTSMTFPPCRFYQLYQRDLLILASIEPVIRSTSHRSSQRKPTQPGGRRRRRRRRRHPVPTLSVSLVDIQQLDLHPLDLPPRSRGYKTPRRLTRDHETWFAADRGRRRRRRRSRQPHRRPMYRDRRFNASVTTESG